MQTIWKVEPHAHASEVSLCGKLSAKEVVREVANCGYDAMFVTDHYTPEFFEGRTQGEAYARALHEFFEGYRNARDAGELCGLRVFPAMELRISAGREDYLVYGVSQEELLAMGCLAYLPLAEVIQRVRATPHGLLYQAHPFRSYLQVQDARHLDGVEVCNANPRHDSRNALALDFAKAHNLLRIAGSDVHQLGDAGAAHVKCPTFSSIAEFTALCKAGRVECHSDLCGESR